MKKCFIVDKEKVNSKDIEEITNKLLKENQLIMVINKETTDKKDNNISDEK